MADDFDWAEQRQFLTSFFFFVSPQERSLCAAVPAFLSRFPPRQLRCRLFLFFIYLFFVLPPIADNILGSQLGIWRRSSACCAGDEEKRNIGRKDASQDWTPVSQSVGRSSPLGWDATTQPLPSAEQSSQAVPEERRTRRPLTVPLGFPSLSWIPFAALILRRLVCADWPL